MYILLIILPCVLVLVSVAYGVASSLLRIWLEHRVKLAFLEKLERNPGALPPFQDVRAVLSGDGEPAKSVRQDYTLTGLLLAAMGFVCAFYGKTVGMGDIAVGSYLGGILCVGLGIALAVAGLLLQSMAKPPLTSEKVDQ